MSYQVKQRLGTINKSNTSPKCWGVNPLIDRVWVVRRFWSFTFAFTFTDKIANGVQFIRSKIWKGPVQFTFTEKMNGRSYTVHFQKPNFRESKGTTSFSVFHEKNCSIFDFWKFLDQGLLLEQYFSVSDHFHGKWNQNINLILGVLWQNLMNGRSKSRSPKNVNGVQFIRSFRKSPLVQFIVHRKWTAFVNAVRLNAVHSHSGYQIKVYNH